MALGRAEGEADADLGVALPYGRRHHPIEADRRQQQCRRGEYAQEQGVEARPRERPAKVLGIRRHAVTPTGGSAARTASPTSLATSGGAAFVKMASRPNVIMNWSAGTYSVGRGVASSRYRVVAATPTTVSHASREIRCRRT